MFGICTLQNVHFLIKIGFDTTENEPSKLVFLSSDIPQISNQNTISLGPHERPAKLWEAWTVCAELLSASARSWRLLIACPRILLDNEDEKGAIVGSPTTPNYWTWTHVFVLRMCVWMVNNRHEFFGCFKQRCLKKRTTLQWLFFR